MEHRRARPHQAGLCGGADPPADGALVARRGAAARVRQAVSGRAIAALGAVTAHWRLDGEPVWRDPTLLADADDTGSANVDDAARFTAALAQRLQVDPSLVHAAYEDIHYYLWRERRLPANVVAEDAKLRDEMERDRLARVFGGGLASPVGSVLPMRRAVRDGVRIWQGGKWVFRDGVLFLVPGDLPIGLRLPLDSLPWADPDEVEPEMEQDPFAPRAALPPRQAFRVPPPPRAWRPVRRVSVRWRRTCR